MAEVSYICHLPFAIYHLPICPLRPHRRKREEPLSVRRVDLAEYLIAEPQAVDLPAALRRNRPRAVIEVLVLGLEKAEVDRIQLVPRAVGAEENAVLITVEELTRGS